MNETFISVLLVEDHPGDARLLREFLAETSSAQLRVVEVAQLSEAFKRLGLEPFDVILLDLSLPDTHGLETLAKVHEQVPEVPIVILTGLADEELSLQAMQVGAQDYLIKGQVNSSLLVRSLRYAIERN